MNLAANSNMATSAHGTWTDEQDTSTQAVCCMYKKQDKLRLSLHDNNGIDSINLEDSVSQVSHRPRKVTRQFRALQRQPHETSGGAAVNGTDCPRGCSG